MLEKEWLVAILLGGVLALLGVGSILWGRAEEKGYFNAIIHHHDVREYLEHVPFRPGPDALKIGGWIAISVGLLVIVIGGVLHLIG